jgi:hypothetical protein
MKLKIKDKDYEVPEMSAADFDDFAEEIKATQAYDKANWIEGRGTVLKVIVSFLKSYYPDLKDLDDRDIKAGIPNSQIAKIFPLMLNGPKEDAPPPQITG